MPTPSAKLAIPLHVDTDVVSTASLNDPFEHVDEVVQHRDITARPFELRRFEDLTGPSRIVATFGPGRAYFGLTMVEKPTNPPPGEWPHTISSPATGTSYWIYMLSTGATTHNTTGVTPAGALPLYKIVVGGTLSALSAADIRPEVGGPQTLGGLNAQGYTQGSVLFVGPSGTVAEDNANLNYVDATNQLVAGNLRVANAGQVDGKLILAQGAAGGIRFGGDATADLVWAATGVLRASHALEATSFIRTGVFVSTVPLGTAPFDIISWTKVDGLNADMTDGFHVGHGVNQVPYSDGVVNTLLNADRLDGYDAGNLQGQVPVSNTTRNIGLNADLVDGWHAAINADPSHAVVRDASGDVNVRFVIATQAAQVITAPPQWLVGVYNNDNYQRRFSATAVAAWLPKGVGSGLDAEFLRGMAPSHAYAFGSAIAVANGSVVTNLNANLLNGYLGDNVVTPNTYVQRDPGGAIRIGWAYMSGPEAAAGVLAPIRMFGTASDNSLYKWAPHQVVNYILPADGQNSGLDADLLDGRDSGYALGNVPISGGKVNVNRGLCAEFFAGLEWSDFLAYYNNTGYVAAPATGGLLLTTTMTDIPGCVLSGLDQSYYLIIGTFYFRPATGGRAADGQDLYGACHSSLDGTLPGIAVMRCLYGDGGNPANWQTVTQTWIARCMPGHTLRLRAAKREDRGPLEDSSVGSESHTRIVAVKLTRWS